MTKILDDLEIFANVKEKVPRTRLGSFDFVNIEENDGSTHESFIIVVHNTSNDQTLVETILHELEHYDVTKTLQKLKTPTYGNSRSVYHNPHTWPEWFHSNPSYPYLFFNNMKVS
jgi:hypothetical protein